jgi:hypothetical protein
MHAKWESAIITSLHGDDLVSSLPLEAVRHDRSAGAGSRGDRDFLG